MDIFEVFNLEFIRLMLRLAAPITLAAIGGTISERSGVINIGLEGLMLLGAFGAVAGSFFTGNPWFGLVTAAIIGGFGGGIMAILCVKYRANQVVSGVGINIMAAGFTTVMINTIWGRQGMSNSVTALPKWNIPGFGTVSPLLILTLIIVLVSWVIFYKTNIGLNLRSIGDHPKAAKASGIKIDLYRYFCVTMSGVLAGLGGAFLSIVQNNLFVSGMTAGRGFMALAANIFGGWNPLGSFLASLVFSFAQVLRFNLVELAMPDQLVQSVPYIITLFVLVFAQKKSQAPEALGEIYE
ncbi:MAG: ABC transporter permease [Halanaerobiales bacterium]